MARTLERCSVGSGRDTAAAEPGSRGRGDLFVLSNLAGFSGALVSTILGLVSVSVGMRYFGATRYGIWLVATSIVGYLSLSQFGIGSATTMLLASSVDPVGQARMLRRAVLLLLGSSGALLGAFVLITLAYPNWVVALVAPPAELSGEATRAVLILGCLFLAQVPTLVFGAAFSGLQQVYWERFYTAAAPVAYFLGLMVVVALKGGLVMLALSRGLAGLLIGVACGVHLLTAHPWLGRLRSRLSSAKSNPQASSSLILSTGLRFLFIGLAATLVYGTDNLVISHFLGAEGVAPYAVTFRLFMTGFLLFSIVNMVVLPMYSRAAALKDWRWIQDIYGSATVLLAAVGGGLWLGGLGFAHDLIGLWVGPAGYGGILVVASLGAYGYVLSLVGCSSSLLQALNPTRLQVATAGLEAGLNFVFSVILVRPLGIGGVALGTTSAAALSALWILPILLRRRTRSEVVFVGRPVARHGLMVLLPALAAMCLAILIGPWGGIGRVVKATILVVYALASWYILPCDTKTRLLAVVKARIRRG